MYKTPKIHTDTCIIYFKPYDNIVRKRVIIYRNGINLKFIVNDGMNRGTFSQATEICKFQLVHPSTILQEEKILCVCKLRGKTIHKNGEFWLKKN